ncbi:hypothetical protein J6590_024559 [Homalodisca vitripennis]|nr:hypothetical protein J6590_024559 [Homalodisca vitripennis]
MDNSEQLQCWLAETEDDNDCALNKKDPDELEIGYVEEQYSKLETESCSDSQDVSNNEMKIFKNVAGVQIQDELAPQRVPPQTLLQASLLLALLGTISFRSSTDPDTRNLTRTKGKFLLKLDDGELVNISLNLTEQSYKGDVTSVAEQETRL